jgi:hypothetical protein
VKLTILTPGIPCQEIGIETKDFLDKFTTDIKSQTSTLTESWDAVIYRGTDQQGKEAIWIRFACLDPHEVQTLILTNNAPYTSPETATAEVVVDVRDFDLEASETSPIMTHENGCQVAMRFDAPNDESYTIRSISLRMKRRPH